MTIVFGLGRLVRLKTLIISFYIWTIYDVLNFWQTDFTSKTIIYRIQISYIPYDMCTDNILLKLKIKLYLCWALSDKFMTRLSSINLIFSYNLLTK